MASFNATSLNYKVRNGNSVIISFGSVIVGFGQSSTNGVSFGTEPLYGIGSSLPGEIQQLKISPTLNMSALQLTSAGLAALGQPSSWLSIVANTQLNFTITDGATGTVLLTYVACTCDSYSSDIPANAPITESTQWMALDVLDSTGTSVLASNSADYFNSVGALASNFLAGNVPAA
jgi:hypothetical protein